MLGLVVWGEGGGVSRRGLIVLLVGGDCAAILRMGLRMDVRGGLTG